MIIAGFLAGAALATETLGVVALWIVVVAGWGWLATTSIAPDAHRRETTP